MDILLSMKNIHKRFSGVHALKGVNLELKKGEVLSVVGENGAGKSTLMNILCGSIRKDEGEIWIENKKVEISNPLTSQKLGISAVQQHFSLIPTKSVAENLFFNDFPMKSLRRIDWKKMKKDAQELLESCGFGDVSADALISDISVADAQRVEVAKAIRQKPKILILDEPSAVLPETDVKKLFQLIKKLKEQGVGIIYISHHMDELFQISDRIMVLKDGAVVTNIDDISSVDQYKLVELMVGREINDIYPEFKPCGQEVVLEVNNLSTKKIKDISFSLHKGEILGFAGLIGSGRTELCRALFGLDKINSGSMKLFGQEYKPKSTKDAIHRGLGFVTEDRHRDGLILGDTVENNICFAGLEKLIRHGSIDKKKSKKVAEKYVQDLKISTPGIGQTVRNLSGGNQQKVVISKWLFVGPKIILLDDATRGIDVGAKREIYALIRRLANEGYSIIMVSSEMQEVIQMSDQVLVMREGRISGQFSHQEATEEAIIKKASGL